MVIEESVKKVVEFLLNSRLKSGWWCDFNTLAGTSDEWVTGYVGTAMASCQMPEAKEVLEKAWSRLIKRRPWSVAWGYNKKVPADTDTTAWVLHFAEKAGMEKNRHVRRAYKFLYTAMDAAGGIPTYPDSRAIRLFTRLNRNISFKGWCSPHPDVTVTVANLHHFKNCQRMIGYIRSSQNENGNWPCYWWCDTEYATLLAVRALRMFSAAEDIQRINKAIEYTTEKIGPEDCIKTEDHLSGSPFATGLALQILLEANDPFNEKIKSCSKRLIEWLLNKQSEDGSWIASARLRIPPPGETHPEGIKNWNRNTLGGGSIRVDQNRLFTSATVLNALNHYQKIYNSNDIERSGDHKTAGMEDAAEKWYHS